MKKMHSYFNLLVFMLTFVAFSIEASSESEGVKNGTLDGSLNLREASTNSSLHGSLDIVADQQAIYKNSTSNPLQNGNINIKSYFVKELESIWLFDRFLAETKALLFTTSEDAKIESILQRLPKDIDLPQSVRTCSMDINSVILAARQKTEWALEMIDATGRPGSGILKGNKVYLGDFDECMRADTDEDFDTHYCLVHVGIIKIQDIIFSKPSIFSIGLCIPSSCEVDEIEFLINEYFRLQQPDIIARISKTNCQERNLSLTTQAYFAIINGVLLGVVIVAATAYDGFKQVGWFQKTESDNSSSDLSKAQSENDPIINMDKQNTRLYTSTEETSQKKRSKRDICLELLMSFSAYTNLLDLFDTRPVSDSIDCIHGIRFISTTWIFLLTTFMAVVHYVDNRVGYFMVAAERWTFSVISQSNIAADSFFTIGGILISYGMLKKLSKTKMTIKFFGNLYQSRFMRLTPAYLMVIMNLPVFSKYMYDGPIWKQEGLSYEGCKESWWANILYINNFVRQDRDDCMRWTWYLAADMQFYILSPFVVVPMLKYDWQGLVVPLALILASAICSGVITDSYDLPIGTNPIHISPEHDFETKYYNKPYTRMGAYIVGMVTGFLLYKYGRKAQLSKWLVVFGWVAATGVALAVVYGPYENMTDPMSTSLAALYNALHRIGWAMSVSWVIYACANGYGGFINTFLSWKAFLPLSRLSYCAYLIHPFVIGAFFTSQRNMYHVNNFAMMYLFSGLVIFTYAVTVIVYLVFEVPPAKLDKIIRCHIQRMLKKD